MEKLIISTSPHIHTKSTTQKIMRDVLIALTPATIAALVYFGWQALVIISVCVATSVLSELLFNLATRRKQTVGDLSAVVTGLILALCIPAPSLADYNAWDMIWPCIVGSVFAIVVVKCLFGGLGCNFANPAATGRILILVAFSGVLGSTSATLLSSYADVVTTNLTLNEQTYQIIESSATPLYLMNKGVRYLPSLFDMFFGNRSGAIGETCALAIIIGFIYLVVRRIIKWYVPVTFVGTVAVFSFFYYLITGGIGDVYLTLYQVMSGGLLFGAVFMATDYVTTPLNSWGKVIFAFGCGIITCLIRFFGTYPEGVSYAILFMNILSPYIEKWCSARPFGGVKHEK